MPIQQARAALCPHLTGPLQRRKGSITNTIVRYTAREMLHTIFTDKLNGTSNLFQQIQEQWTLTRTSRQHEPTT